MKHIVAVAIALLVLAGCSSTDDSAADEPTLAAPATTTPPPDLPACAEVWVAGRTLPKDYVGCLDGEEVEGAVTTQCDSGTGTFATYDDAYWGYLGQKVRTDPDGTASDAYVKDADACFDDPS